MGFLRKVAGAFVHLEEETGESGAQLPSGEAAEFNLDDLAGDASSLLAQLEHHPETTATEAGDPDLGMTAAATAATMPEMAAGPAPSSSRMMDMTADEVFVAAGLVDGANSAQRVLKLLAGLTMFPREQQVVMIRAMDAADDTWSEPAVLEDARKRQLVLRQHLQALSDERAAQVAAVRGQIETTRSEGQAIVADIDRRIAELQQKREEALVTTTTAIDELEQQIRTLEGTADQSGQGITMVVDALSNLIAFFGNADGGSGGPGAPG